VGEKIDKFLSAAKAAKDSVADSAKKVTGHPTTEATASWVKETAAAAGAGLADQARKVSKSQVAKDTATGAAIGAAVAIPIPIIGPMFGGVVGGGIGLAIGLKRSLNNPRPAEQSTPAGPNDFHKQMTELEDLRQKGILTQEEFDAQKQKLLNKL
jgi:hypothetical protein